MNTLIEIGLNSNNGPALIKLEYLLKPVLSVELLRCGTSLTEPRYTLTVGDSSRRFCYENKITRDNEYRRLVDTLRHNDIITFHSNPNKKSWWEIWTKKV